MSIRTTYGATSDPIMLKTTIQAIEIINGIADNIFFSF
jgi:hypothetical protein